MFITIEIMKMKKYLLLALASFGFAVGCTEFRNEDSIAVDTTDVTPTISLVESTSVDEDGANVYSITATITAVEGTSYYSYLIASGDAAELDATALLKKSYSDLSEAVVKYDAESPSTVVTVSADPNAIYTLYAVAANEQSQVGEIVTASITTSNQETPYPTAFEYDAEAGVMYVAYSEAITLGASAEVTATVYAYYIADALETITIPTEDLSIDGGTDLVIALPELYAGSIVYLNWAEGIVENSSSTPAPAYEGTSIYYQVANQNFDIYVGTKGEDGAIEVDEEGAYVEQDGETIYFISNSDLVALFTDGTSIYKYGDGGATCVIVDGSVSTTYTLTAGSDYGLYGAYTALTAYFPAELNYGATASISFDEGAFEDMYGNESNAVSTGAIYYRSRGLSGDSVLGTYILSGYSYFDEATINEGDYGGVVTIAATEDGGYTISGLCYGAESELEMTFNEHSGSIFIGDWQFIDYYKYDDYGTDYSFMTCNAEADASIEFVYSDGVTYSCSTWWGYYLDGAGGYYEVYTSSSLVKFEADPAATPAAVSAAGFTLPRTYVEHTNLPKLLR